MKEKNIYCVEERKKNLLVFTKDLLVSMKEISIVFRKEKKRYLLVFRKEKNNLLVFRKNQ